MTEDERQRIYREVRSDAELENRVKNNEEEIKALKARIAVYDGWRNNTFWAALGLAGVVLIQPFLRFWSEVTGR
jgi:hypothetical protein